MDIGQVDNKTSDIKKAKAKKKIKASGVIDWEKYDRLLGSMDGEDALKLVRKDKK